MNKNYLFGIGIVLAVLVVSVTPALAHVDVYFSPDPTTISLQPNETTMIQVMADVDASEESYCCFQVAVAFDPDVINITKGENPCRIYYPSYGCIDTYYNDTFSGMVQKDTCSEIQPYPGGRFQWMTGCNKIGFDTPVTVPIANLTIKATGTGTSPLNIGHYTCYAPTIGSSRLFDNEGDRIPEANITWMDSSIAIEGTFTKSLPAGWNLISLPLTPLDNSTSAVLGNDTIAYDAVKQYDATTKTFADATTMAPGTGYFVHVTTAGNWTYEGTPVSSTSPGLKEGLNMIGVPNCTMSVSDAMGTADYRYVARWDAADQKFEVYNPSAPAAFYGFTEMTAGEGYFVSAKSDDVDWTVSCPS